jgi:hypothetical protein
MRMSRLERASRLCIADPKDNYRDSGCARMTTGLVEGYADWERVVTRSALLLAMVAFALVPGSAQDAKASRYPLRLHVLAIDDTHPTLRMQPNWCSTSIPNMGADMSGGGSGVELADPCGRGSSTYFGGEDDFSGGGRGDLVAPPAGAQALNFTYDGCGRVRVPPGFQGLPARWKMPGKLEVLIPSDSITGNNRPSPTQRCTFSTTVHEFVFLRLPNGAMLKVSQDAYMRKPSLRVFLSGGSETLQPRIPPTVSVKQLVKAPQ